MAAESLTLEHPVARAEERAKSLPLRHARLLRRILDLDDFQRVARLHLPRAIYGYVANGSEDEVSLATNRAAFLDYRLIPRVLVGVGERSQRTTLLGRQYDAPFGIAP